MASYRGGGGFFKCPFVCLHKLQGVPRNMTVGEYFKMSSSIIFYYSQIDYRLRYIRVKDFSNELNCKKSLNLIKYLEDDILNYSSTVMFRGTPCICERGGAVINRCEELRGVIYMFGMSMFFKE